MAVLPYLPCAVIVNTHGIMGAVRTQNLCDSPAVLAGLSRVFFEQNGTYSETRVLGSFIQKQMVVLTLEGIDSLEKAIPLRGTTLYADRRDFHYPEGTYFIQDMLGLPVLDADTDEAYGTLEEVIQPAGQQIYVVRQEDGGTFMIPAVGEFVKSVRTEGDRAGIRVHLIEGMRNEI